MEKLRMSSVRTVRLKNLAFLKEAGFGVTLPVPPEIPTQYAVRPPREIAARLMALDAVFTWASVGSEKIESERVRGYANRNGLEAWMTSAERVVWDTERQEAIEEYSDSIGWKLENMWALAWALGFPQQPGVEGGMIDESTIQAMGTFLPRLESTIEEFLASARPQTVENVAVLEDLFYCAHNAVRNAQLGRNAVPKGFHPVADGGVVHERRHALTWCCSPGVEWDDTDLST